MVEIAIADDQVAAFVADARAVHVGHGSAGEAEMLDRHVAVGDEDALAVGRRHGRDEVRHATDARDGDVFVDRREVIHIGTGPYGDDVPVARCIYRCRNSRVGLSGPDIESCHDCMSPRRFGRAMPRCSARGGAPFRCRFRCLQWPRTIAFRERPSIWNHQRRFQSCALAYRSQLANRSDQRVVSSCEEK